MSWDGAQVRFRTRSPIDALIKKNRLDPTIGFFWGVVLTHVVFWTILTAKTQPNVPAATLDLLASGRQLAWGYENQPPMAVWISSMVSALSNSRVWPLYLIAQICGMVSVWSAWTLARKFLHPWTALCGAVVLLGGYSCTIAAAELSSTQLASAFWSLSILAFHEALTEERRRYWVATGLLLGFGFLTSYGTFLLLMTMFMFTLWDDRARRCWDSSWPFLAGMLMFLIMLPHLLWLGRHDFITVQSRLASAENVFHHLEQPLSYLGTQLLCLIPVLVLLTPLVAWFSFEEPATQQDEPRDFARQYLLWMTCLPPVVIFGLSLMAGPSSTLFAGVTNWTYLGIAILLWGHLTETRISWRRAILRIGGSVGIFAASLIVLNVMWPQLTGNPANTRFPGKQLARKISSVWEQSQNSGSVPMIVGSDSLVKNAAWNSRSSAETLTYAELTSNNDTARKQLQNLTKNGGVLVYDLDAPNRTDFEKLTTMIGNARLLPNETFRWNGIHGMAPIRVGLAVIHPANSPIQMLSEQTKTPVENTVPPITGVDPPLYPQAIIPQPATSGPTSITPALSESSTIPPATGATPPAGSTVFPNTPPQQNPNTNSRDTWPAIKPSNTTNPATSGGTNLLDLTRPSQPRTNQPQTNQPQTSQPFIRQPETPRTPTNPQTQSGAGWMDLQNTPLNLDGGAGSSSSTRPAPSGGTSGFSSNPINNSNVNSNGVPNPPPTWNVSPDEFQTPIPIPIPTNPGIVPPPVNNSTPSLNSPSGPRNLLDMLGPAPTYPGSSGSPGIDVNRVAPGIESGTLDALETLRQQVLPETQNGSSLPAIDNPFQFSTPSSSSQPNYQPAGQPMNQTGTPNRFTPSAPQFQTPSATPSGATQTPSSRSPLDPLDIPSLSPPAGSMSPTSKPLDLPEFYDPSAPIDPKLLRSN